MDSIRAGIKRNSIRIYPLKRDVREDWSEERTANERADHNSLGNGQVWFMHLDRQSNGNRGWGYSIHIHALAIYELVIISTVYISCSIAHTKYKNDMKKICLSSSCVLLLQTPLNALVQSRRTMRATRFAKKVRLRWENLQWAIRSC